MEQIIAFINKGMPLSEADIVYPHSLHYRDEKACFSADLAGREVLIAESSLGFHGTTFKAGNNEWTLAEQTHENATVLRRLFPFTVPSSVLKYDRSCGVGDRLGIATPGHIRVFQEYDSYPVFAQQSIRELSLTNRTFDDVLDCVSFAVFRENYTRGFGADGNHLKTAEEVAHALSCGYSMITLDCSEHIRSGVSRMTDAQVSAAYSAVPALERKYVGKAFDIEGITFSIDAQSFRRMYLTYYDAIEFAASIYHQLISKKENPPDFEISIDETDTATTPAQHFFVANELLSKNVLPATIAPRFCGDFQKGIDYIGDLTQFEMEFKVHAAIARKFGYKLSIHSGSDKFSVFAAIGKYTGGCFHLKTAGTSWLEAMRIIAQYNPTLYRRCHHFALEEAFATAKKYYHVTTNLANIPPLDTLSDEELPALFENNNARQLIRITYGQILSEPTLRKSLFDTWHTYREEYADALHAHIGKHLALIYSGFRS